MPTWSIPTRRRLSLGVFLAVATIGVLLATPQGFAASQNLRDQARERVAARIGVSREDLRLVNEARLQLGEVNVSATEFKFVERSSNRLYGIILDGHGVERNPDELRRLARERREQRNGKTDRGLARLLETAPDDHQVDVLIYLKEVPYDRPPRPVPRPGGTTNPPSPEETRRRNEWLDAQRREAELRRTERVQPIVAPIVERLRSRGFSVVADTTSPAISGRLPVGLVREAARWPEVEQIYLAKTYQPELSSARKTVRANVVNARGISGTYRTGMVETRGQVEKSWGYLQDVTNAGASGRNCPPSDDHATLVAGVITSSADPETGVSPASPVFATGQCDGNETLLRQRSFEALGAGALAVNHSFGSNQTDIWPDGL